MESLQEALARERMRDARLRAEHARLVGRLRSIRRSRRLERRAESAERHAATVAAADYDLAS